MFEEIKEIFNMGKYDELNEQQQSFNREQKEAWRRIVAIEDKIENIFKDVEDIQTDPKKVAQNDSRVTKRYRTNAKTALDELYEIKTHVVALKNELVDIKRDFDDKKVIIDEITTELNASKEELDNRETALKEFLDKYTALLEEHPDIHTDIESLDDAISSFKETVTKTQTTHKSILSRKEEIDKVFYEIHGYVDEDENGKEIRVAGKKEELDAVYNELEKTSIQIADKQKEQFKQVETNFKEKTKVWQSEFDELKNQVGSLMPLALTKGLSQAYSDKKDDEGKSLAKHEKQFLVSIILTVIASLITIAVSMVLLFKGDTIDVVIDKAPRIVLAVLPIYIPLIWMAYSSDKKAKLSKRLIEEYTHKEVLSKTYAGLSKQVESLPDDVTSAELRIKLLTNILNISGENPGKLISDYNKSDHPIMDVLDQSTKLAQALEKLQAFPGMGKLANYYQAKAEKNREVANQQAEEGLKVIDENNLNDEK